MATSNRDVKLTLSVDTLGEDGIKELQKAVEALGKDGGAAAPEFQKLADEISRMGEQSQALTTFRELSEETDKLAARQADAATSAAQMAERLGVLRAATAAATQRQSEANAELLKGQQAQAKATAALRELKAEYNAAGKNTKDYRDKLLEAVQAQSAANIELVNLRANQKAANVEASTAVAEQSKLETQYKKSAAQVERLDDALGKQNEALREAATVAEALGMSTADVAAAEGKLVAVFNAGVSTVNERSAAIKEMTEADRLLAIEEQGMVTLLARGEAALQAETLAQRDAARAVEQYTAAKKAASASNAAWQQEAEALVNAAHAAQQLARETEILNAAQKELTNQNAFEKQAADAQKLLQAAQYVKFWEQSLEQAETQATQTAAAAQKAAQRIDNAFGTLGVRSIQQVEKELEDTRAAMTTLAAESARTGTSMAGAFSAGGNKIKALEREIRELNGTLTTTDKAASLFKNSLGQIAAGNLIADAVGYMVEKVKELGKEFVRSIVQLDTFRRALNAVYKDTNTTASQLEFLRKAASDGGVSVGGLSASFIKFSASMKSANVPIAQSNALFASLTRAAGTLGLGAERTALSLDALSQIASKGVVSMEELRQQLGDSLPGALSLTAKGLGITDAELIKLVESGQLAARDFFPAFTNGLKELHGETEGLIPTWERLKNAFTLAAENAGDAGWLEILTMGLRALGLAAASVLLPINALFEGMGAIIRSGGVLAAAIATWTNPIEALSEIWGQAAERQAKLTETFDAAVLGMKSNGEAAGQLNIKIKETITATDGLTNSQRLAAIAAQVNGDQTLNAAAKYVQLSIATAQLIELQKNETLNLERVAKARKEEGDTLVAIAKLRGDEQGILEASRQAAEEYAAATARVLVSKQEELKILEQQLVAQEAKLAADAISAEQREKETAGLRELIKAKQAEVEQSKAVKAATEAEVAARRLAVEMYGDQTRKIAEYRAEMERLTVLLKEYERLNLEGKKTDAEVLALRQKLAEATARYKNSVDDLNKGLRLQAEQEVATLRAKEASLNVDIQIAQTSANIARLRGQNTTAIRLEREAMEKQIAVARVKIEIDRAMAELQIKLLENSKLKLRADDANHKLLVEEIDLKIKLQTITLDSLTGAEKLLKLKDEENKLRQKGNGGLGGEASARGNVTEATNKQSDAMEKILMKYTMSAKYSERQIELLEMEAAAAERAAEAYRKKWNIDKDGFTLDNNGQRMQQSVPTGNYVYETAKSQGLTEEEALALMDRYFKNGQGVGTTKGTDWFSTVNKAIADAVLEVARRRVYQQQDPTRTGDSRTDETPPAPAPSKPADGGRANGASGASRSPSEGVTSPGGQAGVKTVNVNLNGRTLGSVNGLNPLQADELTAVLRGLETAQGTAR
ncbi:MAG: tape measure protein [Giesbergeria sp.]